MSGYIVTTKKPGDIIRMDRAGSIEIRRLSRGRVEICIVYDDSEPRETLTQEPPIAKIQEQLDQV